jgi:predicted nucleic acid-binding protein
LPDLLCNTSPLQYLFHVGLLHVLPDLAGRIFIPPAVAEELAMGRTAGLSLPDPTRLEWVSIRRPTSVAALPLITDLGPGEAEVLLLALESPEAIAVLDDALAPRAAGLLRLRMTGTLGLLVDAKRAGLKPAVGPILGRLQTLRFRVAPHTRAAVLALAGETA